MREMQRQNGPWRLFVKFMAVAILLNVYAITVCAWCLTTQSRLCNHLVGSAMAAMLVSVMALLNASDVCSEAWARRARV